MLHTPKSWPPSTFCIAALQKESGDYLLNGGMTIQLGVREFRAAGSKIWYSGSEKPFEQIKIDGKTTEPIKVLVSTAYMLCVLADQDHGI